MEEKKSVSKSAVWLALVGVYIGWGVIFLANKYALKAFPPFMMNGARNLLAGIILYAFLRLRGAAPPAARMWRPAFWVGFVMFCCGSGPMFWGQLRIPSGISALIIGATPLWMVILDIIISKRAKAPGPGVVSVLGVLIGFSGIVLLIGPLNILGAHGELHLLSAAAMIGGAFFWAAGSLMSRTADLPASRTLGSSMLMIGGGLTLIAAGVLMGEAGQLSLDRISLSAVLGFAYATFGGALFSFALYAWLLTVAPAALASTYAFVNPIVAVILGVIVLNEDFSLRYLIASALILVAVIIVTIASGKKSG